MSLDYSSSTAALEQRIDANKSALYDVEEWIFSQITMKRDMDVLDLGCGTGKQMFALRISLLPQSRMVGVDISAEAVSRINSRARHEETENVTAIQCEIDKVLDHFERTGFDLILSTYAIYYLLTGHGKSDDFTQRRDESGCTTIHLRIRKGYEP